MLTAFIFMGAGVVGQVMFSSFKDSFFVSSRQKQAEAEARELLNRTSVR